MYPKLQHHQLTIFTKYYNYPFHSPLTYTPKSSRDDRPVLSRRPWVAAEGGDDLCRANRAQAAATGLRDDSATISISVGPADVTVDGVFLVAEQTMLSDLKFGLQVSN